MSGTPSSAMTAQRPMAATGIDVLLRSGVRSGPALALSSSGESYPERAPFTRAELALIFGFWTLIAVLSSANSLIQLKPRVLVAPLVLDFATAYLWALLTPPIFRLASRYPIERSGWRSRVGFLVLGLAVAILMDVLTNFLRYKLYHWPTNLSPQIAAVMRLRSLWFMNDFIVYVLVLFAGYARNYFLNFRARREEAMNLQAQAAQLQAQLADARLAALRTQLNPHFLFNTLNAISALVERDPRGVRRMIARLSELLRTSLDEADEPEVPLSRELTFIDRYLEVMQIRFQGRLHVRMHADPEASAALVPNLILQPLVENAVKHGVSKMVGPGRIEIRARRDGERVVLSVQDNGPGLVNGRPPASEGVGLRNTRARLAQLYGAEQSLVLRAAEDGGFIAEVSLPYHTPADLRTAAVAAEA